MRRVVILGGGTAGTMMANRLVRRLDPHAWKITVVDRDDLHVYQPGLLFLPFGTYRRDETIRSRRTLLDRHVELKRAEIDRVVADASTVHFVGGDSLHYDVLIIATGSRILPEQTTGLTAEGWRQSAFDFYTLEGALALRDALAGFRGGRIVVNVAEMPIKCPVAPLEMLFLLDSFFTERKLRQDVEIVYATPLEGAFTKPRASAALGDMLGRRRIGVVGDFAVSEVDGKHKTLKLTTVARSPTTCS